MDSQKTNTGTWIFIGVGAFFFAWSIISSQYAKNTPISNKQCIRQMRYMRGIVQRGDITLEQCKKALWLVFTFTMLKLKEYNILMKKRRNCCEYMEKYLQTLILGVQEGKITVAKAKIQAYERMGITDHTFEKYQAQIPLLKKQLKRQYLEQNKQKQLSFGEIQQFLNIEIKFFLKQGQELAQQIIKATYSWPKAKKQYIKLIIPLIIIDKALKNYPHIDEAQFQSAKRKYRQELEEQLSKLSEVSQNFTNIIRMYLGQ